MRIEASFSAVGLAALVAMTDSEWVSAFNAPEAPARLEVQRCRSKTSLVENVRQYDFFGAQETDAGTSLRQRLLVTSDFQGRQKRFTGQTDWHIEWRACFEQDGPACRVGAVIATVHVTYTLPRWADRDAAPQPLRERWDRYLGSLATHEKGHGAIAHDVAQLIDQTLVGRAEDSCDALNLRATTLVEEVMRRGETMQRDYDRATAHGSKQGAVFPF